MPPGVTNRLMISILVQQADIAWPSLQQMSFCSTYVPLNAVQSTAFELLRGELGADPRAEGHLSTLPSGGLPLVDVPGDPIAMLLAMFWKAPWLPFAIFAIVRSLPGRNLVHRPLELLLSKV